MAKKYIDADRLKAEIERRRLSNRYIDTDGYEAELFEIIASLQQEQPCDTCTNDKGCVTCKDGELWEGKEQQEVDLEAEINSFWNKVSGFSPKFTTLEVKRNGLGVIASHFANWQKEQMLKEAVDGVRWRTAKAGRALNEDCLIIYQGEEVRLGRVAVNNCHYLPVSELTKYLKEEKEAGNG